jgi:hypothetical protein
MTRKPVRFAVTVGNAAYMLAACRIADGHRETNLR